MEKVNARESDATTADPRPDHESSVERKKPFDGEGAIACALPLSMRLHGKVRT